MEMLAVLLAEVASMEVVEMREVKMEVVEARADQVVQEVAAVGRAAKRTRWV